MLEALQAPAEARRLEVLRDLGLLDSPPEERFDRITRPGTALFGIALTFVTLIGSERDWFESGDVLVIEDALADSRYAHDPFSQTYVKLLDTT